jgi:hypothetical protein
MRRIGQGERRVMSCQHWMALCFALGSTCFLIGPFPGYAQLVGDSADAITFFIGSILFTAGGGLQSWLAWSERHSPGGGGAAWWVAAGSQPARLHLLRNLGCRRVRRSVDRVDARPGGGQLEHIAGRGVLPGLCARHPAQRQRLEDAASSAAP